MVHACSQLSFYSRSTCVEYVAEFRSFLAPLLTDNFLAGVAMLPPRYPLDDDLSEAAWNERAIFAAFIAEVDHSYTSTHSNACLIAASSARQDSAATPSLADRMRHCYHCPDVLSVRHSLL